MMSILIKDMEMPTDGCHHMICIYADGTVSTGERVYMAVPVPPHGRLVDADKLIKCARPVENFPPKTLVVVYGIIHDAPTIIPAEEGE